MRKVLEPIASAAPGAAALVAVLLLGRTSSRLPAGDLYGYFLPTVVYARQAWMAGSGLGWNPYQACGQAVYGMGSWGLLYPLYWLFLALPTNAALIGVLLLNALVAGVGMAVLCRTLGASRPATVGGVLAFLFSNGMVHATSWEPMIAGPYAWMPWALAATERIIRAPSARGAVVLGVVLAIQGLPGYPQMQYFTYQLIIGRVLWSWATGGLATPWRALGALGAGLVLGPLLLAVQLVPLFASFAEGVRAGAVAGSDLEGFLDWNTIRDKLLFRFEADNPIIFVLLLVSTLALCRPELRARALFWLVAGLLSFSLAFGPNTYLFALYQYVPGATLFRMPVRFLWITHLVIAVLVALGIDALRGSGSGRADRASRVGMALGPAALALVFQRTSPNGMSLPELFGCGTVAVCAAVTAWGPAGRWMRWAVVGALAATLPAFGPQTVLPAWRMRPWPFMRLEPDSEASLRRHHEILAGLASRRTSQERAYLVMDDGPVDPSFTDKTGSVFSLPVIQDYESQPGRRYAALYGMMRMGRLPTSILENYRGGFEALSPTHFRRRLLDLTAVRWLVTPAEADTVTKVLPDTIPSMVGGALHVYENPSALPRAYWVPRVEVVPDEDKLLRRLANNPEDRRTVALLDEAPVNGFLGAPGSAAAARVTFVLDAPEAVELEVAAPTRGFLFLADRLAAGWQATVDGAAAPILRANAAFRLVEVPAGVSRVAFTYHIPGFWLGALLTALGVAMSVGAWWWSRSPQDSWWS